MDKIFKFFYNFFIKNVENNYIYPYINLIDEKINILSKKQKSNFYFVKNSVWPFFLSFSIGLILLEIVFFLHKQSFFATFFILLILILVSIFSAYGWFKNLYNENLFEGDRTVLEKKNLVQAFLLFILIEFMTFAACFWVLLHSGLSPSIWIGSIWPAEGVVSILVCEDVIIYKHFNRTVQLFNLEPCTIRYHSPNLGDSYFDSIIFASMRDNYRVHINLYDKGQLINPYDVPLKNTVILLLSAATITISHKFLKLQKYALSAFCLFITILLGILFVKIQNMEYSVSMLSSNDGIYGSSFFSLTGLHGLHVIIGILFLFFCLINLIFKNYSNNSHNSFEFAIWYWHFVDVIWIFVYLVVYLWPAAYFYKEGIFVWTISEGYYCINMSTDTYRIILRENYLMALKNKDESLYWIGEYLDNYNMNLIRKDVDHFNFFLDMTHDRIIASIVVHEHWERTKYDTYIFFFFMLLHTFLNDWHMVLTAIIYIYIYFKTDEFYNLPSMVKKAVAFLYELFKSKDKVIILKNLYVKNFYFKKKQAFLDTVIGFYYLVIEDFYFFYFFIEKFFRKILIFFINICLSIVVIVVWAVVKLIPVKTIYLIFMNRSNDFYIFWLKLKKIFLKLYYIFKKKK